MSKSFKPRKVTPIPPNLTATIGRYKPSQVGRIFSAWAQEIIGTSINDSADDFGIQWTVFNASDKVEVGSTNRARAYLPILQFIWTFLKGTKQSTPSVNTDSMKISADPKVINKLSCIKRCFLSSSPVPAANDLPLPPPLPPANVSSILQMMAASNSENSQATRKLLAQLVEGHTKLSTKGSSRGQNAGLVCPILSKNRSSLPLSRRLTLRSQRNWTRNTRSSSSLQSSTIDWSSRMLSRGAREAFLSSLTNSSLIARTTANSKASTTTNLAPCCCSTRGNPTISARS